MRRLYTLADRAEIEARFATLTEREDQVIHLVMLGLTNKAVAAQLELSYRTVEVYRARAMWKLGAEDEVHLGQISMIVPPR